MVPALLLVFLHMLLTGVSGNYNINAPPTFVSHDRRNLKSNPISGFISIDCGRELPPNYTDEETEIVYTSDVELIDTGESKKVQMKTDSNPNWKFLEYVRSFPLGTKNCYTLKPEQGRDKTYLVRATFMYGNYDTKNSPPEFDLYLGPNLWDKITFDNVTHLVIKEIMHVFPMDFLDICLLNTKMGVPFISALELRHISNDTIYRLDLGSLETCVRYDYGRYITEPPVRYSEDAYDRIWYPVIWGSDLISINSLLTEESLSNNDYKLPATVMRTAITTCTNSNGYENCDNSKGSIYINWTPRDGQAEYYIYMHFAELKQFNKNREFVIDLYNERWMNGTISPSHLQPVTAFNRASLKGLELEFRIYATNESNLPPLLNAVEFYKVRNFTRLPTQQDDVEAVINIKNLCTIKKHWQGDPCLPDENFMWEGLNCSYNGDNSPRIIMMNLSSSGIAGVIAESLSKLSSLQNLDLSYNGLNGTIPEFLCQMPSLKILNLRGNNLTGSVPQVCTEKFKNGTLLLRTDDNPGLCLTSPCTKDKKNKDNNKKYIVVGAVSVAVATTISLSMVLSVALGFWKYNWKMDGGEMENGTYKGNSISQPHRVAIGEEVTSQDQTMNQSDVATHDGLHNDVQIAETTTQDQTMNQLDMAKYDGLPNDLKIADTSNQLIDKPYSPESLHPTTDQQLSEKSSVVKKKIFKGQGQRRRPNISGSDSSGRKLTQSSYQSTPQNVVDCVRVICKDPALLRTLQTHLKALSPDDSVDTVATATRQHEEDQEHDEEATFQDQTMNRLDVATHDGLSDDVQITEDTSQNQTMNQLDVVSHDGLPDDVQIADTSNRLMDEPYSPDSLHPTIDQQLPERSSVVENNFFKGQGQRRRPNISDSSSSRRQLMQSSYQRTPHTVFDCTHLKALTPDDSIATAAHQHEEDQEHDEEATSQDQTINRLDVATHDGFLDDVQIVDTSNRLMDEPYSPNSLHPTIDQQLSERPSVVKKNFVKGQGQQRLPNISGSGSSGRQLKKLSYQSTPHTVVDCTHLKALSPDDSVDTVETAAHQHEEDQENDEEATSQDQTMTRLDVATHDGLSDDIQIADTSNRLMDEPYSPDSLHPTIDQQLSERSSVVKKNFIKGQGQRRRPNITGSGSSGRQLTQSSYQSTPHTVVDCTDLKALSPDDSVDTVETTARQHEEDQEHDEVATSQDQTITRLDVATHDGLPDDVQIADTSNRLMDEPYSPNSLHPMIDQQLSDRSSIVKKNFVKGQGQRRRPNISGSGNSCKRLTKSSYQSTPHTVVDCTHLKALNPDDSVDTVEAASCQHEEEQEHDKEATSQDQTMTRLDVTRHYGLPDDVQITETSNQLMDEPYSPDSLHTMIDQQLSERSSVVKKNFVKGQGQRRPNISGSGSSGKQLAQSSYQSTPHTAVDCVRAICKDSALLRTLQTHLKVMSPDDSVDTVATTASQHEEDQEHDKETTFQDQTMNQLNVVTHYGLPDDVQIADSSNQLMDEPYSADNLHPTTDQQLSEMSSVMKKNFVKRQWQQRLPNISGSGSSDRQLTQSSYQPTPHTATDCVRVICKDPALLRTFQTHLKALSPDDSVDTVATAARQHEEYQEHDEEATFQDQTMNRLDMATHDGLSDDVQITGIYNRLMDEPYSPDSLHPTIDQQLLDRSSVVKNNFVKGQGQQRRTNNSGSGSSSRQLTQSSLRSMSQTAVDCVRAICKDPALLRTLQTYLKALSPDDSVDTIATAARQHEEDQEHDEDTSNRLMDEPYLLDSLHPTIDQQLSERSSVVKKNFVKGQGQRRRPNISGFGSSSRQLTQSSYQSTPHTAADYVRLIRKDHAQTHLNDMSPDDSIDTVATTARQHEEDQEHDEEHLDDDA